MAKLICPISPSLCRALRSLCRAPITAQPIDSYGFVMGVMGVMGFPAPTRARVQAHMQVRAGTPSRRRAHPITPITPITK